MTTEAGRRNFDLAQSLIRERARRYEHFPAELFAEPAWDILLELYVAQMAQERATVVEVVERSTTPQTTTLRWIKVLDCAGYVLRRPCPLDARRVYVMLTPKGLDAMYAYLSGGRDEGVSFEDETSQRPVMGDPFLSIGGNDEPSTHQI